jgi:biopolymer transport protein ExbB
MLSAAIKQMALLGGEWVLYLLLALSLWCAAVIFERALYFYSRTRGVGLFSGQITEAFAQNDLKKIKQLVNQPTYPEAFILKAGLEHLNLGAEGMEQVMESQRIQEKMGLEKNLLILGTLGNNAPFIGLFGTVLGIIRAFNDLAVTGTSGPTVVMSGVSEALVATAVGLLIAIPAVASFNFFQGQIKRIMANADRLSRLILVYSKKRKS